MEGRMNADGKLTEVIGLWYQHSSELHEVISRTLLLERPVLVKDVNGC